MNAFKKAIICFQTLTLLFAVLLGQSQASEQALVNDRFEVSAADSEYVFFTDRLERAEAHKVIKLLSEFDAFSFVFAAIRHEGVVAYKSFTASFFLTNIYFITLSSLAP